MRQNWRGSQPSLHGTGPCETSIGGMRRVPATASAVVELGFVVICVRSRAGAAVDVITSSSDTSISWPPRVGLDESSMSAQMTQPYANVPAW